MLQSSILSAYLFITSFVFSKYICDFCCRKKMLPDILRNKIKSFLTYTLINFPQPSFAMNFDLQYTNLAS